MSDQISLRIHSVKCVDETGGSWLVERVGNDEIAVAGFGIHPDAEPVMRNPFDVYAHFDDGDIKRYSPPRKFVTLDLTRGGSFPKAVFVGFLLAEKDVGGGFGGKATEVYNKLVEELNKKKLEEAANRRRAGLVAAIGGEIFKKMMEKVITDLYPWVKNKIVSGVQDDIFPMRVVNVTVPSAEFTWNGSKTSPPTSVDFRGHDGVYNLTYDWELS